jgi:hypothetical protein
MKTLVLVIASVLLSSGCASSTKTELSDLESHDGGQWNLNVYHELPASGDEWRTRHLEKEPLNKGERLYGLTNFAGSVLLSNPFKNMIMFVAKGDETMHIEEGDFVAITKMFSLKSSPLWPKIEKIICKHSDETCKEKVELGFKKADGTVTTGSYSYLPF